MKKIRCTRYDKDFLKLVPSSASNEEWFMVMNTETHDVCLDAHAIRKLRKQLKRVLMKIEGVSDDLS